VRWCVRSAVCLCLVACASSAPQHEAVTRTSRSAHDTPDWELQPSERAAQQEQRVAVEGIEGTLSRFDVDMAMQKREHEFAACHEPRAHRVPALAGKVEFKIHVLRTGRVSDVHVRASDLGDRVLERCLSEAIQGAKFPSPHGGEADVVYTMLLEPARRGVAPEQWEVGRVESVLRKRRTELLESCAAPRSSSFTVTAYVSRRGRVLAAGVAAPEAAPPAQFDCIADALRSWPMPRPRKAIAKVTFPLRSGA